MTQERALISQLEAANTEELIRLILRASAEEEKVLRIYLGTERFRRLRNLVLRREMARDEQRTSQRINVVVIPGVLGSELTAVDSSQQQERIWLNPAGIVAGHLHRLRLNAHGLAEANADYTVNVTGIMKRPYGELLLTLAEHYYVQAFWYDWRKDFRLAAAQLQAHIDSWFPAGEPVHLVAHAAGGLVARAYIQQFPQRWSLGGSKLILIGTPNYGLYTAPQAITGHLGLVRWVDLLDVRHDRSDFREIVKSFPSLYQLLPAPGLDFAPGVEPLYDATTYGSELNVSQEHLTQALHFHAMLKSCEVDPQRMIYLTGHNQPTFVDVNCASLKAFDMRQPPTIADDMAYLQKTYTLGLNGDGTVPHFMGVLRTPAGKPALPAYYVEALHGNLCSHPKILMAIQELLAPSPNQGELCADKVAKRCDLQPLTRRLIESRRSTKELWTQVLASRDHARQNGERKALTALIRRVSSRSDTLPMRNLITVEERNIEERLLFGFVSGDDEDIHKTYRVIEIGMPTIKINLVAGDITDRRLGKAKRSLKVDNPIDAIAVGHYSGGKPYGLLRTLDYKLSLALAGQKVDDRDDNPDEDVASQAAAQANDADLLLTQYTQRGTIRSDLAQTFFLADPRAPNRVITIAGMGEPGRFGMPELAVLVRELCWTLGRMGKKHLATVLIGAGRDNLSVPDAVAGWVRGIKLAISGMDSHTTLKKTGFALQEITFFVTDPRKLLTFDEALLREQARHRHQKRMTIIYTGLTAAKKQEYLQQAMSYVQRQMKVRLSLQHECTPDKPAPTRITVSVEGNKYRFGAITDQASIPEREIPLDPALVRSANDELAAAVDTNRQLELGQFMQRLLIPADLRNQLTTGAPLVMMLDATTARIHWELLAESDLNLGPTEAGESHLRFLATSRGFTRQLRTLYAPPPEPPPPAQRHLRVLVVADPAEDAPLPGAEEEGIAVADLFEQFNIVYAHNATKNRVEVVRLFGPREATRTTVLRHLMLRTYDVLHFAGHCVYDPQNPAASGWIFSNGERLSAYEFTRIDRSPAFIFSNACESGVTPARSDKRSVELAPSFAESFFARGVSNFVCTAWPVEDRAARDFALSLYAGLLGLTANGEDGDVFHSSTAFRATLPLPIYAAMQQARLAIATPPSDARTWGAYQHYGNPYFRFFDLAGLSPQVKQASSADSSDEAAIDRDDETEA